MLSPTLSLGSEAEKRMSLGQEDGTKRGRDCHRVGTEGIRQKFTTFADLFTDSLSVWTVTTAAAPLLSCSCSQSLFLSLFP